LLAAVPFSAVLALAGPASPNLPFPVVHALTLLVMLGIPRVAYRRLLPRAAGRPRQDAVRSVLLVGSGGDSDLFLRALARDQRRRFQVDRLPASGSRQTGRRIQGQTFLGSHADTGAVLERLAAEGRLPDTLVITAPDLSGADLATLVTQAERFGLTVAPVPFDSRGRCPPKRRSPKLCNGSQPGALPLY
jgi:O-antigen biosynthesis protein WbqV